MSTRMNVSFTRPADAGYKPWSTADAARQLQSTADAARQLQSTADAAPKSKKLSPSKQAKRDAHNAAVSAGLKTFQRVHPQGNPEPVPQWWEVPPAEPAPATVAQDPAPATVAPVEKQLSRWLQVAKAPPALAPALPPPSIFDCLTQAEKMEVGSKIAAGLVEQIPKEAQNKAWEQLRRKFPDRHQCPFAVLTAPVPGETYGGQNIELYFRDQSMRESISAAVQAWATTDKGEGCLSKTCSVKAFRLDERTGIVRFTLEDLSKAEKEVYWEQQQRKKAAAEAAKAAEDEEERKAEEARRNSLPAWGAADPLRR